MLKDPYLKDVYQSAVEQNQDQKEFLQAVQAQGFIQAQ